MNDVIKPGSTTQTAPRAPYHHGDLRSALLDASEAELAEKGIERFSLRGVAKRAGVSHAAPAHHFGDSNGLLSALAARGFHMFLERQQDFKRQASASPDEQIKAATLGYVNFALENPALFRLMFSSDRPDFRSEELDGAATAGFMALVADIERLTGSNPFENQEAMLQVSATWALAHGMADLLCSGRLKSVGQLEADGRNAQITAIMARLLDSGDD
ncbi:MAG: TetR/AcrR family transcriptional regulator [Hoeflea sp.]|uniref:TetR/AcrR family transcriptional regulator n=1 Tax=Hoeflea sp. TaxID=1940281 RepID=UPI0032EB67A0